VLTSAGANGRGTSYPSGNDRAQRGRDDLARSGVGSVVELPQSPSDDVNSTAMLEQARRRLGAGADLQVADLASPLPFGDGAFDDIIASLVLQYLEDWGRRQPSCGGC
jgi:hypothetical protein